MGSHQGIWKDRRTVAFWLERNPLSSSAEGRLEGAARGKVRSNNSVGLRELASAGLEEGVTVMVCLWGGRRETLKITFLCFLSKSQAVKGTEWAFRGGFRGSSLSSLWDTSGLRYVMCMWIHWVPNRGLRFLRDVGTIGPKALGRGSDCSRGRARDL